MPFPGGSDHPSRWPVRPPPDEDDADQLSLDESDEEEDDAAAERDDAPDFEEIVAEEDSWERFTSDEYVRTTTEEYRDLAQDVARAADEDVAPLAPSVTIPGLDTGLVGFEDMTGEEQVVTAPKPHAPDLTIRVATGLVLAAIFLAALLAGGGWVALVVGVITIVALGEFYTTLRRNGYVPAALFGYLGAGGLLAGVWFGDVGAIPTALAITTAVVFIWYALGVVRRDPLTNGALTLLGVGWIAGGLAFALPILAAADYFPLILSLVAVTMLADTVAYFAGRRIGKRPLAPVVSPKKTVEGLVAGTVTALAAGAALGWIDPFDVTSGLALGAIVAVFGPPGDLAESALKRALGVKDMGSILPGHGGLVDRIDALLFIVPAAYVLFELAGYLG